MASHLSILVLLSLCIAYTHCALAAGQAKVGGRAVIEIGRSGDYTREVGGRTLTFHFSGPNRGSFTDARGKKVPSSAQIQGNYLVISKVTKADAGTYLRGADAFDLIVL